MDLESLQSRIAMVDPRIAIHIGGPHLDHSAVQATAELLDLLLANGSNLHYHYDIDATLDGVQVWLERRGERAPVTFWGTPSGYELEGLVYALECWTSPAAASLDEAQIHLLREIVRPLASDLYVAPT